MLTIRAVMATAVFTQLPHALAAQGNDSVTVYGEWNIPRWVLGTLDRQFRAQFEWYDRVNPFFQRGDFDGDGQTDIALLIRQRATGKIGIAIVHRGRGTIHILGAGTPLGNGGDDFSWLGVWRVEDGRVLREIPAFRGEIIYVEKPEAAGGLIYWDGTHYQWVQRGD